MFDLVAAILSFTSGALLGGAYIFVKLKNAHAKEIGKLLLENAHDINVMREEERKKHEIELQKAKRITRHYEVAGSGLSPYEGVIREYVKKKFNDDFSEPQYVKPMYQLDLDIGDMQASELWLKDPPYCPNMTEAMIRDIENFMEKTGARPEDIVIAPTIIAPDGTIRSGIEVIPREVY